MAGAASAACEHVYPQQNPQSGGVSIFHLYRRWLPPVAVGLCLQFTCGKTKVVQVHMCKQLEADMSGYPVIEQDGYRASVTTQRAQTGGWLGSI